MRPALISIALSGLFAQSQGQPPEAVAQIALDTASAQLDVPSENLLVIMAAQRDWPDSSLGCPEPGKAYSQIVTPGWIVYVDTDDLAAEVLVHTDYGSHGAIC